MTAFLTEDQIERIVEVRTNNLDELFLHGRGENYMTQAEYDNGLAQIKKWADAQYKTLRLAYMIRSTKGE